MSQFFKKNVSPSPSRLSEYQKHISDLDKQSEMLRLHELKHRELKHQRDLINAAKQLRKNSSMTIDEQMNRLTLGGTRRRRIRRRTHRHVRRTHRRRN